MKTKLLKLLVLVAGFAAYTGFASDIIEILPCDEYGVTLLSADKTEPYARASSASPLGAGETFYFKLRLGMKDTPERLGKNPGKWQLWHNDSMGSLTVDYLTALPRIGLQVTGDRIAYAELVPELNPTAANANVTDFVFKYTTQPGDFAMPIKLAVSADGTYLYQNLGVNQKWNFVASYTESGNSMQMVAEIGKMMNEDERRQQLPSNLRWSDLDAGRTGLGTGWITDADLEMAAFYTRTVDFGEAESADAWRLVKEGSSITLKRPVVVSSQAPAQNLTVYVWSEDDDIITVEGEGILTDQAVDAQDNTRKSNVLPVKIAMNSKEAYFDLRATGQMGDTTTLYLSATPHFNYNAATNDPLDDYVAVTVECDKAPEPRVDLIFGEGNDTVLASSNWAKSEQLTVKLSDPRTTDVTVTITPTLTYPADGDVNDYLSILSSKLPDGALDITQTPSPFTVTIPAGETTKQVYVYAKKNNGQIALTSTADDTYFKANTVSFTTTAEPPIMTYPTSTTQVSATMGVGYPLRVSIKDAYWAYKNGDYQIAFKENQNDDTDFVSLGSFTVEQSSGELKDVNGDRPTLMYTVDGDWQSTLRVTSSTGESVETTFVAKVKGARKATITSLDVDKAGKYNEGDLVSFKLELSEASNVPLYAYLLPNKNADVNKFKSAEVNDYILDPATGKTVANASKYGLWIDKGYLTMDQAGFLVQDGAEGLGTSYNFEVVLTTGETFDPDEIVVYQSNLLRLNVKNLKPSVNTLYFDVTDVADEMSGSIVRNGGTYRNVIPVNQTKTIRPFFADPGAFDLTANFGCYWIAESDQGGADEDEFTYPNAKTFDLEFTTAGTWTISLYVKDKDMTGYDFDNPAYTFQVNVTDQPEVLLDVAAAYYEDTTKGATINVRLGYFPTGLTKSIVVKLTVANPDGANAEQGPLTLSQDYKTTPTFAAHTYDAPAANEYYIVFNSARTVSLPITTMDGTIASSTSGFKVTAAVVGSELGPDGTYVGVKDEFGNDVKWSAYYKSVTDGRAFVENVDPICTAPESNTNAWNVAAVATSNPITFMIRSDVTADMDAGIQVTITGCQSGTMKETLPNDPATNNPQTNPMDFKVYAAETFTFTPNFGTAQGEQTVYLTIADKDGVGQTWKYLYNVSASKFLYTRVSGPAGAFAGSNLSQYYHSADGLGQGHVTVNGATNYPELDSAGFNYRWDCGKALEVDVTASGFKAGVDTKTYMQENGGAVAGLTGSFTYNDTEHDSFFYTWLMHIQGENGTYTSNSMGLAPEQPGSATSGDTGIPLPKEATDGSYANTRAEAIFAKEFRPLDNCGDINGDGIPDLRVVKYWPEIVADGKADLADLSALNEDEDFLPAGNNGGNSIMPNASSEWASQGGAFKAYQEIRGWGAGLNAGYKVGTDDPNPDYSINEMRAYLLWKGIETQANLAEMNEAAINTLFMAHLDEACADLALANSGRANANNGDLANGWSPERPTDPTDPDTDKDGISDGYEYWFWYGAKVGYNNRDGVWQGPMTGRALNIDNLLETTPITATDILRAFDPLKGGDQEDNAANRETFETRDSDNDGLTDLEEMAIGTNPLNCDTDGGGVPDGYEVMWGFNPLSPPQNMDDTQNPDGDFMAHAVLDGDVATEPEVWLCQIDDGVIRRLYIVDMSAGATQTSFTGCLIHRRSSTEPAYTLADLDTVLLNFNGMRIPQELGARQVVTSPDPLNGQDNWMSLGDQTIDLIHDQVHTFFGFDPRTAWSGGNGCIHGCVTPRWCVVCNQDDARLRRLGDTGRIVNTQGFTVRDEYLFGEYARRYRGNWNNNGTILERLQRNCTNPNVSFENRTYGTLEQPFSSSRHGADTNGDGCPDGWTIYCGADPISEGPPPWGGQNSETDGMPDLLLNAAEFAGTDTLAVYANCPTIASNGVHTAAWLNKFFPTNPASGDTDGDGMMDSAEGSGWESEFWAGRQYWAPPIGFTFIYGTSSDDGRTVCFRGGGLNPCCFDTDYDGLPDDWERQYAGIVVSPDGVPVDSNNPVELYTAELKIADGVGTARFAPQGPYIMGGMDGTFAGDAATTGGADILVGTERDYDFDRDGLENFQEYLTQAVRVWRYDDSETPLMGRAIKWNNGVPSLTAAVDGFYPAMNLFNPEAVVNVMEGNATFWTDFITDNDYAATLQADGQYDFRALGYMAPADHVWDPVYQMGLVLGRADEGLWYMRRPRAITSLADVMPTAVTRTGEATVYISTDPRQWDSDHDGMDDYWEVFHGLNPLLGLEDLVSTAYGSLTFDMNLWSIAAGADWRLYDPILAPWTLGLPNADPDGDGLRNLDEAISGNLTNPTTYHTDPTPLWMTDESNLLSYIAQCYVCPSDPLGQSYVDLYASWIFSLDMGFGISEGASPEYLFSFERTEGYDTDGDWRVDSHEIARAVLPASDPLNAGDPDRRAALYLPGRNACAYSFTEGNLPVVDAYDIFRQFTVECWVKPDVTDREQTILERGFVYAGSNLQQQDRVWRANFRLAVNNAGRVYGLFDNDNAVDSGSAGGSSQRVVATALPAHEWSHLALTFDGKELSLYVNGTVAASEASALIPANGISALLQEPATTNNYPMASYSTLPGANVIGARRVAVDVDLSTAQWDAFGDFFQGYVSEVRFWDGARTADEIKGSYRRRLTQEEIVANRQTVYQAWDDGATRNDMDGKPALPAQLLSYYNFQQLPAGANTGDVAQTPSWFNTAVQNNSGAVASADLNVGWWSAAANVNSTVYADRRIVPWIHNVVSHLPLMDQSFADSMYWSQYYAGYTPASFNGSETYAIPNGGNPYKSRNYIAEADLHRWRLLRMAEYLPSAENHAKMYEFEARSQFVGLDDLVPLGDAYARLDTQYWDDAGVTTVWTDTRLDADGDGLPDWWEALYAGLDPNVADANTTVTRDGVQMPASEAYLRDLAAGVQPSDPTNPNPEYANKADADGDGLMDWWQQIYAVKGGANGDDDGDGLPNYVEYLLTEYFKLKDANGQTLRFSPVAAYSVNEHVSDYFYPIGKSYVGAIFTDHDFIADAWEDKYAKAFVSRYLYDALADADGTAHLGDGWSNFAEFQAGTDPTRSSSLGIDGATMSEYPVPMVEATLVYLGDRAIANVPVVVKAWREATPSTKPDAVWTIGSAEENKSGEGNSTSNVVQGVKHLGMNPGKTLMFHLSPGNVVPGSVKFFMKDTDYTLLDTQTYQRYYSESKYAIWADSIVDKQSSESLESGVLMYQVRNRAIGTINYETGAVTIDLSGLDETAILSYDITATGSTASGNIITLYNHMKSYVKVEWQAKANAVGASATYYLADADEPSETNNSSGHLCEGKNTFVAFWDIDGNGQYTAGEPYGVARNVDVGWNKAKVYIEMTDTSPVTARFSVQSGESAKGETSGVGEAANDRRVIYGADSTNVDPTSFTAGQPTGGTVERVRIVRTRLNDEPYAAGRVPARVVLDKQVVLANDSYITEADIFAYNNQLDIDWEYLATDIAATGIQIGVAPVTNITYHIVLGDAPETDVLNAAQGMGSKTNNYLNLAFRRKFDAGQDYMNIVKPVPVGAGECLTPSPTFSWVIPKGLGTYTAFILKLMDENGTEIWDSGFQSMPPRKKLSEAVAESIWRYDWTAPIYAGALLPGSTNRVFENGKQYQWKVAVVNSLYKNNPNYSEARAFTMNVQEHSADYGAIRVGVRYFGPVGEKVLDQTYPIRVQAFATPDFSGVPVSEGYVTDVTSVTDQAKVITTANAKLIGLEQGTYYVRAFIDTETDGQRANWESWGYVCTRDVPGGNIFTPQSIVIGSTSGPGEIFPIYIEDCDTEQDSLPDAWEWSQKGNLTDLTVTSTTLLANGVLLNKDWATALTSGSGTLADGLAARLTAAVNNPYAAAMVMGVDVSDTESAEDALTVLVNTPPETTVEAKTVSFTTVDFDLENNQVKLVAETDLASKGASTASSIYTFTATDTLTLRMTLLAKATLDQTAWTIVETKEIEVSLANPTIDQTIDLGNQVAPGNGFFKITLEEIQ